MLRLPKANRSFLGQKWGGMARKIILVIVLFISSHSFAFDDMTLFMKDCAYGTAAGALLGLLSLTTSDNPNGKISNVARGASLGLYLGIAYGIYDINNPRSHLSDQVKFWIAPEMSKNKLNGAELNWIAMRF